MSRRSVVQRWPAVPAAEKTMPRTARSRSADGVTMAALLPPSSSSTRPNRSATRGPTCLPIRTDPVADTSATRGSSTSSSPTSRPPRISRLTRGRCADIGAGPLDQRLAGDRGQRGELGGLPHHGVAAHQRDRGVPRPHRDREVEGGDDADHTQRVPGFHQPVPGPLGGDGAAVQLTRQPDGEVADVDHLLHLAEGLGGDLARLDGHQRRQIGLVRAQQLAQARHQLAAHRRRGGAPRRKCLRCFARSRPRPRRVWSRRR